MIKIISHNWTGQSLLVVSNQDGKIRTKIVADSHPNWSIIVDLYKQGKYADMVPLMDMDGAINAQFGGAFSIKNSRVYYREQQVHGYLIDKILLFMREMPKQAARLVKFAENLYSNPNPEVIANLYKFLEHKNMPITEDGCFLAYKGVRDDYYSITSGSIQIVKGRVKDNRIFNGIGEEVIVERSQVCSDSQQGCSQGLHVGSWQYANNFRNDGKLMVLKVNPRDAVSVPNDCDFQKLRTCCYQVIAEDDSILSEILDADYDKYNKQSVKECGKECGKVASSTRFCRDSLGRFVPKS